MAGGEAPCWRGRAPLRSFQGRESADLLDQIIGPLAETYDLQEAGTSRAFHPGTGARSRAGVQSNIIGPRDEAQPQPIPTETPAALRAAEETPAALRAAEETPAALREPS